MLLWLPVEVGMGTQAYRIGFELLTAADEDCIQGIEIRERTVGKRLIDERPEPLRGLHLWAVRRQEEQEQPWW